MFLIAFSVFIAGFLLDEHNKNILYKGMFWPKLKKATFIRNMFIVLIKKKMILKSCWLVLIKLQIVLHIPGAHETRRKRGRSVQLLYKTLCQPLSNKLHKMPIYGQTLSKQGGGAKSWRYTKIYRQIAPNAHAVLL